MKNTAPTRDFNMPAGGITTASLRELADAVDRLDRYHITHGGKFADRPCLRRVESTGEVITAHLVTGPAVGGIHLELILGQTGWMFRECKEHAEGLSIVSGQAQECIRSDSHDVQERPVPVASGESLGRTIRHPRN